MATIAEQLVGSGLQSSQNVADISGAYRSGVQLGNESLKTGAELAQAHQNIQKSRADIENQKEQLELAKLGKINEMYETAGKMPEGKQRNAFLNEYVPNATKALGWADKIHPVVQKMLAADPNSGGILSRQVQNGSMTPQGAAQVLADPEAFAKLASKQNLDQFEGQQAIQPTQPGIQGGVPDKTETAYQQIRTSMREGTMNMRHFYSPEKRQAIQQDLGIDEATLNDVINTYPKGLSDAENEGIQNNATKANANIRNSGMDERSKRSVITATQAQVNRDPALTQYDQLAVGAQRINDLIDNALNEKDPSKRVAKTKQLMGAVAAEESKLVSGKNNFSESQTERAAYDNAASEFGTFKDKFGSLFNKDGTVTDVQGLTAQLKNAKVQANELGRSYIKAMDGRFRTLTSDEGALPEQLSVYEGKRKAYREKFQGAFGGGTGTGTMYTLPNGKQYSADQIQTMIANNPALAQKIDPKILKSIGGSNGGN